MQFLAQLAAAQDRDRFVIDIHEAELVRGWRWLAPHRLAHTPIVRNPFDSPEQIEPFDMLAQVKEQADQQRGTEHNRERDVTAFEFHRATANRLKPGLHTKRKSPEAMRLWALKWLTQLSDYLIPPSPGETNGGRSLGGPGG